MITAIPLAGRSQRFKDAGYKGHKVLLPMPDGRPMLAHVLESLSPKHLIPVVAIEDGGAIGNCIKEYGRNINVQTVFLFTPSNGPLDTLLKAAHWLNTDDELLINYCDCWLTDTGYFLRRARLSATIQAAVATFQDDSNRYQRGRYNQAIGGVFWFRSGREFIEKAQTLELNDQTGAPQVAYLFEDVAEINVTGMYVDLGTPEDYEAYLAKA